LVAADICTRLSDNLKRWTELLRRDFRNTNFKNYLGEEWHENQLRILSPLKSSGYVCSSSSGICISSRTVEAADVLYIGDGFDNTVKGFDADTGTPIDFGNGKTGIFVTNGSGGLDGPRGLIFNKNGDLVVANQNVDHNFPGEILAYHDTTGVFLNALVPHLKIRIRNPSLPSSAPHRRRYFSQR
jgi:hypothetical protein